MVDVSWDSEALAGPPSNHTRHLPATYKVIVDKCSGSTEMEKVSPLI